MKLLDSRRLTGPNLLWDREGAVLDVALSPEESERLPEIWAAQARRILDAVGWGREEVAIRRFPGGASLALSAPVDALYAATEVNDWAWTAAETVAMGREEPSAEALAATAERLREEIRREGNPALLALRDAAAAHGASFLSDDEHASVGLGTGSLTWPVSELPAPDQVDWSRVHDVPVLLVTGTNGKTTTVRLLASILQAAGRAVGVTSTDRIQVGGEVLDHGDFSGPGGARTLLRDPRVEVAVLETARGGLLRRGLAVHSADAALITNIAADHLGDLGVADLSGLADVKLVITRAIGPEGRVVLNADDPLLVERAAGVRAPVVWFGLDPDGPVLRRARDAGGEVCFLENGELVRQAGDRREAVARVDEIPLAFGGAARYNVANALAAVALAGTLGISREAIAEGLRSLRSTPEDNPGRANLFEVAGVRLLVDYAHNPHGVEAVLELARSLPAERKLIVLGQAGDRDDEALRDLVQTVWKARPDRVVIKELPSLLRGRELGDVPAVLDAELRRLGMRPEDLVHAETELEGIRQALAWARPGDLLLLLVHSQRDEVLDLIRRLEETGWAADETVPT